MSIQFSFSKIFFAPTAAALILLLASGLAYPLHAAGLGYVDALRLIEQAPQGTEGIKKVEKEFAKRKKALQGEFKSFQAQEDKLKKNGVAMTPEQVESKARELRERERKLRRDEREFNEDFRLRRNEELGKLEKIITEAVIAVAKREKMDMVLQQVVYASPQVDLTKQVLAELKQRHAK